MVATDLSHVPLSSLLQPVGKASELKKGTSLSLKIGTPGLGSEPSATSRLSMGSEIMTPSCSPAATPPTGPAPPGLEMGAAEDAGSGAMFKAAHFQQASKRHKKDKHIKELKGGLPPLNVHDALDIKGGSESDTPDRADAADTPDRPADGSESDSDHSEASSMSEGGSSDESLSRPRKRGCTGLDTASSSKAEEEELLLPGVTTIELPCLMEPYAQPAELAKATTKDWAEVNWEEVEYELDAEDDRWLEGNRESGLDASQLEFLIDRLEKMKAACADGAEVSVEQIASLVSDVIQPEAVVAAAGWWQEKSAGREESLLRRLQPPTDFDNLDSARVFRPGRRQRSIRERKESVNYREMSTGEINRLARQESAEQRKARIEAEKARREQIRERKRLLEEQEIAEAERLEEEGRKRKRDEERAIAAARKEQQIAERVGSVLERIVRTIVRDDRDRRRLEKAERERIAAELRRQKQMAIQKRRDDAEIAKVFQSIVVELEAEATRNAKLNAREQARLRREQASAKLAELASSRLKDNSVSKGVRQARGPVRAIAYDPVDAAVVAACVDNSLWRGRLNPTAATEATAGGWETVAVEWTQIGTALNVVSQAVLGDHLFACDRSNTIWRRSMRVEPSAVVWEHWGKLGTKQNGVMALTASTGHLYAATNAGKLMRTDASAPGGKWSEVGLADKVRAMASAPGQDAPVQFALSADGSFWRRSGEAGTWGLLGTPDTKLVVANGIAATESVVVGSDSTSILCCSWATCGEGGGDDKAERKPSHWWRSLPLPPVVVGKKPGVPGAGPGRKPGRRKKVVQQPVQAAGTVAGQQSAVPAAASSAPAAKAGAMPDSAAAAATASA